MKSAGRLEKVLTAGKFAVTAELGPPQNANPEAVKKKAQYCLGSVDGANITDNQTAIVRMSSIAAAAVALSCGVEPVVQMVCRDRNRIAMQSDILGAAALGIKNLLCLSGDHQKFGNHPQAKNVFDMDSIQLIAMVKKMRDDKQFLSGDPIKEHEPRLFIGAVENPFADPFEFRVVRLAKKIEAGADFIGLVFAPSRGQVSVEEAQAVARALGGEPLPALRAAPAEASGDAPHWFRERTQEIETMLQRKRPLLVGVFADAAPPSIDAIAIGCGLDLVQLSGHETWEVCLRIAGPVIKALRVGPTASADSVLASVQAGTAHLCLLDSDVQGVLGGSGQTFDWGIAAEVARRLPVVLAGGLTPENVGEAVRRVRPWAVDVSSGVETEGAKDVAKIRAFIAAAKEA